MQRQASHGRTMSSQAEPPDPADFTTYPAFESALTAWCSSMPKHHSTSSNNRLHTGTVPAPREFAHYIEYEAALLRHQRNSLALLPAVPVATTHTNHHLLLQQRRRNRARATTRAPVGMCSRAAVSPRESPPIVEGQLHSLVLPHTCQLTL